MTKFRKLSTAAMIVAAPVLYLIVETAPRIRF